MTSLPILLPDGFKPVVKSGDKVAASQIIAQKTSSRDTGTSSEEVVDLSKQLGLSPDKVAKVVKKNPGDSVAPGEVLAVKKQSLGLKELKVVSQAEGTVVRFERDSGRLIIRLSAAPGGEAKQERQVEEKILSPVAGKVDAVREDAIVLMTDEKAIVGEYGSGKSGEGELREMQTYETRSEYLAEITGKDSGVIIAMPVVDKQVIAKSDAVGVVGIICESISEADKLYLHERRLSFPLVKVSDVEYKRIVKQVGKRILLNGETRSIIVLAS